MNKLIAGLCAAALLSSAAAAAEGPTELRPFVGLGIQYVPQDTEERDADDAWGVSAGGGVPLNKWFAVEGEMYYDRWNRDNAPNNNRWRDYGALVGGLLTIPVGYGWVPFLSADVGVAQSRLKTVGNSTDLAYALGAGTFYLFDAFERDWGLRFDARYRVTRMSDSLFGDGGVAGAGFTDDVDEAVVRFGVIAMFGDRAKAAAAPVETPVEPAKAEGDADNDGVVDSKDQCPDTPAGVKVNDVGCPEAAQVGGAADELKRFGPVYFDFDKSEIKASERPKLDAAAKYVKGMPNAKILVRLYGHTDELGTTNYNQALGERRAAAVKNYLLTNGVPGDRIETTSFGETKPAGDNATAAGRALNRRVEVLVVEQ